MTSFKTTLHAGLAVAAIVGGVAMSGAASAGTVNVNGVVLSGGVNNLVVGNVFEDRILAVGDTLSGIGRVSSIEKTGGNVTWVTGQNGIELTYAFSGFKLENATSIAGQTLFFFSGGSAQFYTDPSQNFTASSGNKTTNHASATDGTLFLSLAASGSKTCADLGITCASGQDTIITLSGGANGATLAGIIAGHGDSVFNVTGGAAASNFDTNGIPGGFDISAGFDFDTIRAQGSDYDFGGSVSASALVVPEPGTLALFGASLIGLAAAGRRRRRSV